jgi:hypothetical protein
VEGKGEITMRKTLLLTITALLFIACNIQKKGTNIPNAKRDVIASDTNSMNDEINYLGEFYIDEKARKDISDAEKALEENEIKDINFRALLVSENILSDEEIRAYDFYKDEIPMGTYFWDEFGEYEGQYSLTDNESKLLGRWVNTAMNTGKYYRYYTFFPNKFCVISIKSDNYIFVGNEKKSLDRTVGTWEIADNMVKITIYSMEIKDKEKPSPNNKDIVLLDRPYTVDFINIDDIDARGYTKKSAYDWFLSEELQRQVKVRIPNKTKNLYLRNIYTIDFIPVTKKNYGYFAYFSEMAEKRHTGLEIAVNPELIRKYFPYWMYF